MKKRIIAIVCALAALLSVVTYALAADPGSEGDPLVTRSYVDAIKNELYTYINSIKDSFSPAAPSGNPSNSEFEIVTISPGRTIACGASCEVILRSGRGIVVGSPQGGICDVTGGIDLPDGAAVTTNHHLIVPRNDGRGISAIGSEDAIFMIKGSYTIL